MKVESRITLVDILKEVDDSNYMEFKQAYDEVTDLIEKNYNKQRKKRRKQRLLNYWIGCKE